MELLRDGLMWHPVELALRFVAGVIGGLAIYAGLFLYEDEQGRIQNTLEDWWVRLSDQQQIALSRHTAFMREVANLTGRGYDRLFGEKLLSLRALAVSACYSIGLVVLDASFWDLYFSLRERRYLLNAVEEGGFACLFLSLGTLPVLIRSRTLLKMWSAFVLTTAAVVVIGVTNTARVQDLAHYSLILLLSFGFDVCFIAATRWLLRWGSDMDKAYKIVAVVLANILVAAFLFAGPRVLATTLQETHQFSHLFSIESGKMVQVSNSIDVIAALAVVALALALLAHRLLWPLINRPIYALATIGGVRRKLFLTLGVGLITFAAGGVPAALNKIIEIFRG